MSTIHLITKHTLHNHIGSPTLCLLILYCFRTKSGILFIQFISYIHDSNLFDTQAWMVGPNGTTHVYLLFLFSNSINRVTVCQCFFLLYFRPTKWYAKSEVDKILIDYFVPLLLLFVFNVNSHDRLYISMEIW